MDSLGAISSEKSPMRPWREGNWLGRRSRTSPWAIMSIVCANDVSMYVMRIAVSLVGGHVRGALFGGGLYGQHILRGCGPLAWQMMFIMMKQKHTENALRVAFWGLVKISTQNSRKAVP